MLDHQIRLDSLRGTPIRLAEPHVVFWWIGPTDLGRPKPSRKGIGVNTPTVIIRWRHLKRADSSAVFESADIDPYAINPLIDTILEALSSRVLLPIFWCKHMPLNFGIKVILLKKYMFVP